MPAENRNRVIKSFSVDQRIAEHVAARANKRGRPASRELEYLILRGLQDCGDMVPGMSADETA